MSNRREDVYVALRAAIIENALKPGTKLPEDSIASSFGVSRTIIREVLARLRNEGLVDTSQGKSATVAMPGPEESAETFHVRRCLERDVVSTLVQCWQPEMADRLRAHTTLEEQASADSNYPVSDRLGVEFHILLAELTSNRLLHKYVSEVALRCALIIAVHGHDHDQSTSIAEHHGIVDALQAGDACLAIELIDQHLTAVEERTLQPSSPIPDLPEILSRYSRLGDTSGAVNGPAQ